MSIVFVFGLITIVNYGAAAPSYAELEVSIPPPSGLLFDDEKYTYVKNESGIYRVDIKSICMLCGPFDVENDVIFQLFTQKNPTEPQILKLDDYTTVKTSHFDSSKPTRILIHGWYSEGLLTPRFAEAYLTKGKYDVNFIAVNWQNGSDVYNYFCARGRVNEMGEYVARFINFMSDVVSLKIKDLQIVGHSLGAHIAGLAGKKFKNEKVGKIVGLDPAGPTFNMNDVNNRLAETDASYVEAMYTCAGFLAFSEPIGATNFYPNGGRSQPGCGHDIFGACAHGRAYEYYLESIVRPEFIALECDSLKNLQKGKCLVKNSYKKKEMQMGGEPGNFEGKGLFYLETNNKTVFAKGYDGIENSMKSAKFSIV